MLFSVRSEMGSQIAVAQLGTDHPGRVMTEMHDQCTRTDFICKLVQTSLASFGVKSTVRSPKTLKQLGQLSQCNEFRAIIHLCQANVSIQCVNLMCQSK